MIYRYRVEADHEHVVCQLDRKSEESTKLTKDLRYLVPQVVKIELPYATNWRAFIYFL